jgi:hypothetical protein
MLTQTKTRVFFQKPVEAHVSAVRKEERGSSASQSPLNLQTINNSNNGLPFILRFDWIRLDRFR